MKCVLQEMWLFLRKPEFCSKPSSSFGCILTTETNGQEPFGFFSGHVWFTVTIILMWLVLIHVPEVLNAIMRSLKGNLTFFNSFCLSKAMLQSSVKSMIRSRLFGTEISGTCICGRITGCWNFRTLWIHASRLVDLIS